MAKSKKEILFSLLSTKFFFSPKDDLERQFGKVVNSKLPC